MILDFKATDTLEQPAKARRQKHEIKLVFRNSLSSKMIGWLAACCPPDPTFPCGTVNSVYFDTPDGLFAEDKISSFFLKTKVRVRWYADIDNQRPEQAAFFEVKSKTGSQRSKIRIKIPYSGPEMATWDLLNPAWLSLPQLRGLEGWMPPGPLAPSAKVVYRRRRFLEPRSHSRLAIDYDLRVAVAHGSAHLLDEGVFEIKGDLPEVPPFLYPLTDFGCRRQSFSKYGSAMATKSWPD